MDVHAPIFNKIGARDEVRALANIDDRMEMIEKCLERDPNSRIFKLERARAYVDLGKLDLARRDLDLVTDFATNDPEGFFVRGYVHWKLGNDELALLDLSNAIKLGVKRADCYYLRSNLFFSSGNIGKAIDDLEDCIDRETTNWHARELLVRCLDKIGRQTDARLELNSLLTGNPDGAPQVLSDHDLLRLHRG